MHRYQFVEKLLKKWGLTSETVVIIYLTKGYEIRFINQGDSVPQEFIPKLITMYQNGSFPFDRLIRNYPFEINQAIDDSQKGITIKAVLSIGQYAQ